MISGHAESYYQILGLILVRDHSRRRKAMGEAVACVRAMDDKLEAIGPTLERLVATRMEDGLDLARELLMEVGGPLLGYTEGFLDSDAKRWSGPDRLRHHANDDAVYVLLRTLGNAGLDRERTTGIMRRCLAYGNPSIRDAAIWALGDMGTKEAYAMIRLQGMIDCSASVRDAVKLVLEERGAE